MLVLLVASMAAPAHSACLFSLDPVEFGVIDTRRLALSNGRVRVDCDTPSSFSVAISGNSNGRAMTGPDNAKLIYQLYPDATYSRPWGDVGTGGDIVSAQSDGTSPVDLTIYGLIPPQNFILPGMYTDNLTVTLAF